MTTASTAGAEHYAEAAVAIASQQRGEPDWLRERRIEAARAYAALPVPTPALRPWRYTDLAGFDLAAFPLAQSALTIEASMPAGGFAGSLSEAATSDPMVREQLGSLLLATEGKFLAANAAQWRDGVLVRIPRGAALDAPVVITIDGSALAEVSIFPRLLIVAEERSEAVIVVRTVSGEAPLIAVGAVEVLTGQGARVKLLFDDRWGAATRDFTFLRARVGRDADVQIASLAMGGALYKQHIDVLLDGEGGSSSIRAVALGDANQHFDFVTLQDHIAPTTTSLVEVKAALAGASRSAYYGVTRVGEGAQGADADQTNRNLLLSGESKADSDPVLEILTANVRRCGHHAAVGPVDPEALFYLESRGLDRRASLQLLVAGFFQSVLGDLGIEGAQDELAERVAAKLGTAAL